MLSSLVVVSGGLPAVPITPEDWLDLMDVAVVDVTTPDPKPFSEPAPGLGAKITWLELS